MVTQSEIQRIQRQQFAQANISGEDIYSRMQRKNATLNIQRQQQYDKSIQQYQQSISNYVNSMKSQGINLKPVYDNNNLTGFEDIDKGVSIPLSNIDRYLATRPFMKETKPFDFRQYTADYASTLKSIPNPPKPKPQYYKDFKTFVQNTSFDKGVWLRNLPKKLRNDGEAYFWYGVSGWADLVKPNSDFTKYAKMKLNESGGKTAALRFNTGLVLTGLTLIGGPTWIKAAAYTPIVEPALSYGGQVLPQKGVAGRISGFLYAGGLTLASVKYPTLGRSMQISMGKQTIERQGETFTTLYKRPEYLLGGIAGGLLGAKVFAKPKVPKVEIKVKEVNVMTPMQRSKIRTDIEVSFNPQDISAITNERLSLTRAYETTIRNIKNPKQFIHFEIVEFGKFIEGTQIPGKGARRLFAKGTNEKGDIVWRLQARTAEKITKSDISELVTEAFVFSGVKKSTFERIFRRNAKQIIQEYTTPEKIIPIGQRAIPFGRIPTQLTRFLGDKFVTLGFAKLLPAKIRESLYKSSGKLIKGKSFTVSGVDAEILWDGLYRRGSGFIFKKKIPFGYKIIKLEFKYQGDKVFTDATFKSLMKKGTQLPKTTSVEYAIDSNVIISDAVSMGGPGILNVVRRTEGLRYSVGKILTDVEKVKLKQINRKIKNWDLLSPEELRSTKSIFNKLKIKFTKDSVNNYARNIREKKVSEIENNQITIQDFRQQPSKSIFEGTGLYERTDEVGMLNRPAGAAISGLLSESATQYFNLGKSSFSLSTLQSLSYINPTLIKSNQQFFQNAVESTKLNSNQMNKLVELQLIQPRELEMLKQPQMQKFVQRQLQRQLQRQKLIQKQMQQPQRPMITTFLTPTPRVPIIPIVPIEEDMKRKQMTKQNYGYSIYVKEPRSKTQRKLKSAIRLPVPPMPRQNALDLLAYDIDNTVARSGYIKKVKRLPQTPRILIPALYFNQNIDKFRFHRIRKGKKYPIRGVIEKTKNIIDTRGEKQQLKSYKLISQMKRGGSFPRLF